jgi:hypothetical protein
MNMVGIRRNQFTSFIKCLLTVIVTSGMSWAESAVRQDATQPEVQETPRDSAQSATDSPATDPAELRRAVNAVYTGVPFAGKVARTFEMYSPRTEEAVQELKAMGFDQVMLDRPNLHSAAAKSGMKFVLAHWWNHDTKPEDIAAAVDRARQTDRALLAGFSIMDEPERNSPDTPFGYYIDVYEKLKPLFTRDLPETRLEISHWGPLANWTDPHYEYFSFLYEAADVMRIMPYPDLHEGPLDEVFYMTRRTQRLMDLAGRELPLVVILQTWILPPENKLPDIEELRVMTYQAMLSGAETVSFFDHNPEVWQQTPGFTEGFRRLMNGAVRFRDRYRNWSVQSIMSPNGILTAMLTSNTGQAVTVQINTRREPAGGLAALEIRESPATTCPQIQSSSDIAYAGHCSRKSCIAAQRSIRPRRMWRQPSRSPLFNSRRQATMRCR